MGDDGSNKREIYKGGNESGKATCNPAIGIDFDVTTRIGILGEPEDTRFREGTVIFRVNLNTYSVELFDDGAYVEGGDIPQSNQPL
jgi:hypothetical protein